MKKDNRSDNEIIDNFFIGLRNATAGLSLVILHASLIIAILYSLFSAIANIIHFNILIAIGWGIATFVSVALFVLVRTLMNPLK